MTPSGCLMRSLSAVLLLPLMVVLLTGASRQPRPLVTGLDHIIILVNDLEAAASRYRALGFALKPGRPHDNGIRNQHVKFEDGTELELLTAPEAKDALTAQYRRYLAQGDGPAHVVLYPPDAGALAARIVGGMFGAQRDGLITFPIGHRLRPIFFGGRNKSPTDRPEHFAHGNSAYSPRGRGWQLTTSPLNWSSSWPLVVPCRRKTSRFPSRVARGR